MCFQLLAMGSNELPSLGTCFLFVQEQHKSKKLALKKCQGQVLGAARERMRLSSSGFMCRALVGGVVLEAVEELCKQSPWGL